jgi:DegV family protein with EDD domain
MLTLVADSTADLSPSLVKRYSIRVVPLSVFIAGQTYEDGVDLDQQQLFALCERYGELPKTAAPSVASYMQAFDGADKVVYVGVSSNLSASIQNAHLAAQQFPPGTVQVVDSANLSTGIGLLMIKAAEMRDQGASAEEVSRALEDMRSRVRTGFVLDTLKYMYMGGRISAIQNLMGAALKVRPVIGVDPDGRLMLRSRIRGSRERALDWMLDDLAQSAGRLDSDRVFVTHAGYPQGAEYLSERILKMGVTREVLVTEAGAVISSHCGPGTIGILYMVR